jgi:3-methyladenine DNA glycosylase AlkD
MTAAKAEQALRLHIRPEKVEIYQNFFKTGPGQYGHGDIFLGVKVPDSRIVAKAFRHLSKNEIKKLIQSKFHEVRLLGFIILTDQFEKADPKEQKAIYEFYLKNKKHINNWDMVDSSCPVIMGGYLYGKDKKILYKLAKSKRLWDRRLAVLATFHFIRNNDFKDILQLSAMLLNDEEDLMHKAVGWMLREMGKKNVKVLEKFLSQYATKMPRTMLRYSIEKFSPKRRKKYLNM